jgi:hypothetical protein
MIGLIKLVLSANFIIGVIVGVLAVVGYLYSVGNDLSWKK